MSEITEKIKVDASFVKAIVDMQRDLDAYHFAFVNIIGILRGKFCGSFVPAISQDMAASQRVNDEIHDMFLSAKIIREVYEKLIEGKGNPVLSIRIEDCDLSVRARNVCKHVGIETLGDLTKLCKTDLFKTRMVGKGTIGEFDDLLSKYGLTWAKWESA